MITQSKNWTWCNTCRLNIYAQQKWTKQTRSKYIEEIFYHRVYSHVTQRWCLGCQDSLWVSSVDKNFPLISEWFTEENF